MHTLFIVATPIGNLEDLSIRAMKVLLETLTIACEDTRRTGLLIKVISDRYQTLFPQITPTPKKYISIRDFNEKEQVDKIIYELNYSDVALVSDAGTPLISDPGYKLVNKAKELGIAVVPIPGPSAVTTALSVAGLPTDKFMYWGFNWKVSKLLVETTNVIFESPKRTNTTIEKIKNEYPFAKIIIARELTKIFEYVGPDDGKTEKGEVVILVYIPK